MYHENKGTLVFSSGGFLLIVWHDPYDKMGRIFVMLVEHYFYYCQVWPYSKVRLSVIKFAGLLHRHSMVYYPEIPRFTTLTFHGLLT